MRFTVEVADAGKRLDHFLLERMSGHSRARLQAWIKEGRVLIDGAGAKASHTLRAGEHIDVAPADPPPLQAGPEDLPLEILYEDPGVIAVNKPAGLTVHAGAGAVSGTLVNRLVHHFQSLSQVGGDLRPGIVHRLDKDTSGVLLVARNDAAHRNLAEQFASRTVEKTYLALVQGEVRADSGRITKPIARDPVRRTRMTAKLAGKGRTALTEYRVLERFRGFTFLEIRLGTGRTHQIRVHMADLGHRVAGDRLYGAALAERMFLHAWRICFLSPETGERVTVEAPLPPELQQWLARLRII
ncbi:MAG TPA: RluA family pseudouridine synthase [Bryobacteraceae bacterium]|jgi:23S rRNA pseudouridine1911/1915/1917 synthase